MRPKIVVCGSFHKDADGLRRLFKELEVCGCRILSPVSLDFTDLSDAVVSTNNENDLSIGELEKYHLRTIRDADLVWLHAPEGYVGISAAYEIGYANALQKPVFCFTKLADEMLQTRVIGAKSVFEGLEVSKITFQTEQP